MPNLYHHPHVVTVAARKGKPQRIGIRATENNGAQRSVLVAFIEVRSRGRYLVKMLVKHDDRLKRGCIARVKQRYGVKIANNITFIPSKEKK